MLKPSFLITLSTSPNLNNVADAPTTSINFRYLFLLIPISTLLILA